MPAVGGLARQGLDGREAHRGELEGRRMRRHEGILAFKIGQVRHDVVGVDVGFVHSHVDGDMQGHLGLVLQGLDVALASGNGVDGIEEEGEKDLASIRIALVDAVHGLRAQAASGEGVPGAPGRVAGAAGGLLLPVLGRLFVDGPLAGDLDALGLSGAAEGGKIKEPLLPVSGLAGGAHVAALLVDGAHQHGEHGDGVGGIGAANVVAGAVVLAHAGLASMGSKVAGRLLNVSDADAGELRVGFKRVGQDFLLHEGKARGAGKRGTVCKRDRAVEVQIGRGSLVKVLRLASGAGDSPGLSLILALEGGIDILHEEEPALLCMSLLGHDKVAGVCVSGEAFLRGERLVEAGKEGGVEEILLQQHADEAHGERVVLARLDGKPGVGMG